jgi:hypothetical protein
MTQRIRRICGWRTQLGSATPHGHSISTRPPKTE